jgi:hypothetical protein
MVTIPISGHRVSSIDLLTPPLNEFGNGLGTTGITFNYQDIHKTDPLLHSVWDFKKAISVPYGSH